jgi:hypothetical protein
MVGPAAWAGPFTAHPGGSQPGAAFCRVRFATIEAAEQASLGLGVAAITPPFLARGGALR